MSFQFQSPWMFAFLLLIPALLYHELARRPGASLRFSSTDGVGGLPASWRMRLARLPLALRAAALLLLVTALARPVSGRDPVRNVTELADRMRRILDKEVYVQQGQNARARVERLFSRKQWVDGDESIYLRWSRA